MTGDALRVVLATEFYPPNTSAAAASVQRLAHRLTHAGVELVVCACTELGAQPITAGALDRPRVYRVSCVFEAFVLLDIEEERRPFDVLHAIGWRIAAPCLHARARRARPLLVSVEEEDVEENRAARILDRADWIACSSAAARERLARRSSGRRPGSAIAPEDGERYARLYARLARGAMEQDAAAGLAGPSRVAALPVEDR